MNPRHSTLDTRHPAISPAAVQEQIERGREGSIQTGRLQLRVDQIEEEAEAEAEEELSIHQSTNPSIHQSINPSIHRSITPSFHHSTTPFPLSPRSVLRLQILRSLQNREVITMDIPPQNPTAARRRSGADNDK
jgi:hypothetical protein